MLNVLFILLGLSEGLEPKPINICLVSSKKEAYISMRREDVVKTEQACVSIVECAILSVPVFEDPESEDTFYVSKSTEKCM